MCSLVLNDLLSKESLRGEGGGGGFFNWGKNEGLNSHYFLQINLKHFKGKLRN